MLTVLTVLFLLFSAYHSEFKLIKSVTVASTFLTTDNLSNCYVINNKYELLKYDNSGNLISNYNYKALGMLNSISAYVPLEVFLFYKDVHQIIYLDKTLSQRGTVNLEEINLKQVTLACPSFDKGIWVWDEFDFEVKKINKNLSIVQKSGNLAFLTELELNPNFLTEYNNWIYLNNPETGVLVLDIYGTYLKNIPIQNLNNFQILEDELYYLQNNKLNSYNLKTFDNRIIALPVDSNVNFVRIEKDRLFILDDNSLNIYEF